MTTPTKNEQYIGKIVIKGVEEVRVFGPTLKATITELNHYIEQYKLEGPMDIAVYKDGFKDPIAIVEQEEETPTKEQIEHIAKMIFITHKPKPITKLEYDGLCDWWDRYLSENCKSRYRARAMVAITEWEKIKDVDARVEKLYKLGTQDWVDFYKAINSPK